MLSMKLFGDASHRFERRNRSTRASNLDTRVLWSLGTLLCQNAFSWLPSVHDREKQIVLTVFVCVAHLNFQFSERTAPLA
mmetsp:Transcript_895/g.2545  ORF Transcript_895/g.2545 Transcript_895/m.2545 type:complete len:80 (+) Transcript_895:1075-1314(+)